MVHDTSPTGSDSTWRTLYRIGGIAAMTIVAFTFIQMMIFFIWPPPPFEPTAANTIAWYTFFQKSAMIGLLDLDLLLAVDNVLLLLLYLALCAALRRVSESLVVIAATVGIVAVAVQLTSNPAFTIMTLSDQYAAAATEAERSMAVAAGQSILAIYHGTPFDVSYVLGAVAVLIFSFLMLRSDRFGKVTAYMGIVMGAANLVPSTAGTLGFYLSFISLIPMVVWLFLTSRSLMKLAKRIA